MTHTNPIPHRKHLPESYDEYLKLCLQRRVDPVLNQSMFESYISDSKKMQAALMSEPTEEKKAAVQYLQGLPEEQVLRNLGFSQHLEQLSDARLPRTQDK